jgi:hypothetical protein
MSAGGLDGLECSAHTRCVDDYAQGLGLQAFQYLNVGCGCCAPKLDAISPDDSSILHTVLHNYVKSIANKYLKY